MTTVLVTGAAGFIGRRLVSQLAAERLRVVALDKREMNFTNAINVRADIRDLAQLRTAFQKHSPDLVLHLAAQTDLVDDQGIAYYDANTLGVENLVRAIEATKSVKFTLCTSSQLVCGPGYTPKHDEDYAPTNLYGESKMMTEKIWRAADGAGVPWAIVRPTTVWGPHMNPHYMRFFRLLARGMYVHVGHRPVPKTYGYVANVAYQMATIARSETSLVNRKTFYVADYDPIDLREWVDKFRVALAAPPVRTLPMAAARPLAWVGDLLTHVGMSKFPFTSFRLANLTTPSTVELSKTRAVCGAGPYTVDEGVAETAAWLRSVLDSSEPQRAAA